MNTLIAYFSKYGCSEKCAINLSKKLNGNVDLLNLKKSGSIDLSKYDKVIIGGPIYIGKISKEVSQFCSENLDLLKTKKLGLYICGMRENDYIDIQINASFPKDLIDNATSVEYFGGEFIFEKMNFIDRLITKKVAKVNNNVSNILEENIDKLARVMNNIQ
ncbi:flavodoxin domain-containing protein [Alkalithermobacter paradoxus]|uniref:Protoporphyrinogen oxidase n=1 Tax=Alkalithermobacter paradoxus TaxID=29349 RepID=A0A1V4I9S2_9FIRM|nr:protoporphyrinogen oxidase [[Clostridium] thermoalcaliphilum]